jgi:MFS family permease
VKFTRRRVETDPASPLEIQKKNFRYVQIDAIAIGLANAAAPFLPIFLTRLGASSVQVGLLTSMPALTGLIFAILIGNFLQKQRNIVPWFSAARLLFVSSYALTGLVPFLVPEGYLVQGVLVVFAIATIPQTILAVSFSVVMNAVAGPEKRYELMSRRWSTLGATTAITVVLAGQLLDRIRFPLNYQIVFIALSIGGFLSYYFSSHIRLPDNPPLERAPRSTIWQGLKSYTRLILGEKAFVSFSAKRFVYLSGVSLAAPLFPLFYVRVVHASNAWIGIISTSQTAVVLFGYYLWARQSKVRGSRFVLLWTTFFMSIYPALVAANRQVEVIAVISGMAGIFQAGLDLVFFDELMKSVPVKYSASFVSFAQSLQNFSAMFAPLVGTYLADYIGIPGALMVSTAIRLAGFMLFAEVRPLAAVRGLGGRLRRARIATPVEPLSEEGFTPPLPPPESPSQPG